MSLTPSEDATENNDAAEPARAVPASPGRQRPGG